MTNFITPSPAQLPAASNSDEAKFNPQSNPQPLNQPSVLALDSTPQTPLPSLIANPSPAKNIPEIMVSNTGGDISDADTQEPIKNSKSDNVIVVEESDSEDVPSSKIQENATGKMKAIIEKINADSGHSEDDEPSGADDVDFGQQAEDDIQKPDNVDKVPLVEADNAEEKNDAMEVDDEDDFVEEEEKPVEKVVKKKGAKVTKTKKEAVVKTIKKTTDGKANKGKAVKGKASSLSKNKGAPAKSKASTGEVASTKTSPKPKKTVSKTGAKVTAAKSETKPRGKGAPKASESAKDSKPKKIIAKQEKPAKKSTVAKDGKKATGLKTNSKKAAAVVKKSSPVKKRVSKVKPEKKTPAKSEKGKKGKTKKRPISKCSDDEEDDVEVVVSEGEEASSGEESEGEEEVLKTPASKHTIVGNLACSSRDGTCTALLDHAVQQLGKYNIVSYGADSDCSLSAYIIGKGTKRGWGILLSLANGVPLVSEDWLSTSISEGQWKPMNAFRSDKFGQSPRSVSADPSPMQKILDGHRVKVISKAPDLPSVKKLLKITGARVAETRMDVIINDTGKAVIGCTNVTKKWLADSVEAGEALDYDPYVIGE